MAQPAQDVRAQIVVAQEALEEANRRRTVAHEAVVDFALRAVVDGQDIEAVMDACGFRETGQEGTTSVLSTMFGIGQGTPRQRFGTWLGQELCNRICAEPKGDES